MLKIAIVNSDESIRNRLSLMIQRFFADKEIKPNIALYDDGNDFLENEKDTDLLIVDFDGKNKSGLQIAKDFREKYLTKGIIFLIEKEENAILGYQVSATGCLLKPIDEIMLDFFLNTEYLKKKDEDLAKISIKSKDGLFAIRYEDIAYIEIKCHTLMVHYFKDGDLKCLFSRSSLKEYEEKLSGRYFAKCCVYALVNLKYVSIVKSKCVYIAKAKTSLPLSASYKETFVSAFMKYLSDFSVLPRENMFFGHPR